MLEHGGVSLHCVGMCARQRSNFSLLRQRKVTKRKATPVPRPRSTGATLRCSRKAGSAELALRAQTTALLFPPPAALLSSSQGGPKSQYTTARCASPWLLNGHGSPRRLAQPNEPSAGVGFWGPRWRRRAAQGKTEKEVQMSEPAGRVSELPGLTEQHRAVPVLRDRRIRGRLSFGDFSLAKQRKGTALSGAYPDAVQRTKTPSNNEATP
jgi:hypothetical protein